MVHPEVRDVTVKQPRMEAGSSGGRLLQAEGKAKAATEKVNRLV